MLDEFVEQFVDWQAERTVPDAEAELRQFVSQILHPDPSSVEEMAGVVAFLCSSDASYMTGQTIPVDGGQAAD